MDIDIDIIDNTTTGQDIFKGVKMPSLSYRSSVVF